MYQFHTISPDDPRVIESARRILSANRHRNGDFDKIKSNLRRNLSRQDHNNYLSGPVLQKIELFEKQLAAGAQYDDLLARM